MSAIITSPGASNTARVEPSNDKRGIAIKTRNTGAPNVPGIQEYVKQVQRKSVMATSSGMAKKCHSK